MRAVDSTMAVDMEEKQCKKRHPVLEDTLRLNLIYSTPMKRGRPGLRSGYVDGD